MPSSIGTRTQQGLRHGHADQGSDTRSRNQDVGMSKRVVSTATFTTDGKITGANGDFTAFAVGDTIEVQKANLNNGYSNITAIDGASHAFITVEPPPKAEGPLSVVIRAA